MKYDSIIVIGPPYSGKGTQCQLLARLPDFYHFSSGEMFRKLDCTTELGAKIRRRIDKGQLAEDQDLVNLTSETLLREVQAGRYNPQQQYLLLDGLPRTVSQLPFIEEMADVRQVLVFNGGSPEELIARARKRFGIEGRADDSDPAKIQKRLDTYFQQTEAVIRQYSPEIIVEIDSTGSANLSAEQLEQRIQQIHQDVLKKILRKR